MFFIVNTTCAPCSCGIQRDISPGAGHAEYFGDVHHQVLQRCGRSFAPSSTRRRCVSSGSCQRKSMPLACGFVGQLVLRTCLQQCGQIYFSVMHAPRCRVAALLTSNRSSISRLSRWDFLLPAFQCIWPRVFSARKGGILEQVHIGDDGGQRRFQVVCRRW